MKKFFLSICLFLLVFTASVYADTEQDEINQVLSIFKSYEYNKTENWSGDTEIFYYVYDNRGIEYQIHFHKAPRFDKNNAGSAIMLYNSHANPKKRNPDGTPRIDIVTSGTKSTHYPVQEFINEIRADSRIALGCGWQGSSQPQQKSQQSTSQNNNSSASYQTITISEYYAFKSQYYNKKVVIDAYLSGIDEQCFIIYGKNGGVLNIYYNFPAESVRKLMSYENHKVRVYAHGIKIYGSADALYCDKIEID